jgi:hypothetical protein
MDISLLLVIMDAELAQTPLLAQHVGLKTST